MANMVSFTRGSGFDEEAAALERQRRIAEAMLAQSEQPLQGTQAGRVFVAPHWSQGLAQVLGSAVATRKMSDIDRRAKEVTQRRNDALTEALAGIPAARDVEPGDGMGPFQRVEPTDADYAKWTGRMMSISPQGETLAKIMLGQREKRLDREDQQGFRRDERIARSEESAARAKEAAALKREMQNTALEAARERQREAAAAREDLARIGGGAAPFFQFLPTPEGYAVGNSRTGTVSKATIDGQPVVRSGDSPELQGRIAGAKKQGQVDVERAVEANDVAAKNLFVMSPLDRMSETADEIILSPGVEMRTGLSSYVPAWAQGDAARNTQAKVSTLKSQIAQNVLQMYRNMSQTGGAVGQVSNFEQQLFIDNLAALDQAQTKEEFVAQLKKIQKFAVDSKKRIAAAYQMQFGKPMPGYSGSGNDAGIAQPSTASGAQSPSATTPGAPSGTSSWDADKRRRYEEWKRRSGK